MDRLFSLPLGVEEIAGILWYAYLLFSSGYQYRAHFRTHSSRLCLRRSSVLQGECQGGEKADLCQQTPTEQHRNALLSYGTLQRNRELPADWMSSQGDVQEDDGDEPVKAIPSH